MAHKDTLTYLATYFLIKSQVRDGKEWFAFFPTAEYSRGVEESPDEAVFKYHSKESAERFALGWVKRNFPNAFAEASNEAKAAEKYRASLATN